MLGLGGSELQVGLDGSDASFVDTRCKGEFNSRIGGKGEGDGRHPLVDKKTGSICTTTTTTITTTGGRISLLDQCVCDVGVRVCAGVWCASEPGGRIPLLDQCVCGVDVCVYVRVCVMRLNM